MHNLSPYFRAIIFSGLFVFSATLSVQSYAANDYTNSAHGDSSSGVQRTSSELSTYAVGNCAHCHEQHGTILGVQPDPVDSNPSNFLLFTDTNPTSQTTNFCFECHQTGGSSRQSGGITNNDYSTTFGGQATASTVSIKNAFAQTSPGSGSGHDLTDVLTELTATFSFTANDNPCGGCHNPHLAQKNNATGVAYSATYFTNTAISRPGDRENLWGDAASERMQVYASGLSGAYRAPFYVGANPANASTLHEPDGQPGNIASANVQGANTPDYASLCLDCHSRSLAGTNPARTIPAIPWVAGDGRSQHGPDNAAGSTAGSRIAPYTLSGTSTPGTEDVATNFILSCLDCHESHGSTQANGQNLLRTTVNGTGVVISGANSWRNFCTACHVLTGTPAGSGSPPNHAGFGATTASCNNANCHGHSGGSQNF